MDDILQRAVNGLQTEIYVGGGNGWLTQRAPTNFHGFWKRKVLTPGECVDDFRVVSDSERQELLASDEAWVRPEQVFIDEWNARCVVCSSNYAPAIRRNTFGRYNEKTGFFELNGLTDITYEQAVEIMRVPDTICLNDAPNRNYQYSRARTFFPIKGDIYCNRSGLFEMVPNLEVARIVNYYIVNNGADPDTSPQVVSYTRDMFYQCPRLREVKGVIKLMVGDRMGVHFYNTDAPALETIWLHNVCLDIDIKSWKVLRQECLAYMVEHAGNTKAITITLHADVFAGLSDELIAAAAGKNISFATPAA